MTSQTHEGCPDGCPDTLFIWEYAYSPSPFFTASLSWS